MQNSRNQFACGRAADAHCFYRSRVGAVQAFEAKNTENTGRIGWQDVDRALSPAPLPTCPFGRRRRNLGSPGSLAAEGGIVLLARAIFANFTAKKAQFVQLALASLLSTPEIQ